MDTTVARLVVQKILSFAAYKQQCLTEIPPLYNEIKSNKEVKNAKPEALTR